MLLRKAKLPSGATFHVLHSVVLRMYELAPRYRDRPGDDVRAYVLDEVRTSVENDHVFENPERPGQYIAYAELGKKDLWFVLAPNDQSAPEIEAAFVVITVLIHKDKRFREEMAEIEADCA